MNKIRIVIGLQGAWLVLSGVVLFNACTAAQKQTVRTVADVAAEACRFAYGQHPEELPLGLTPEQFCGEVKNVKPFIDHIFSAQREQATVLGTRRTPEPDVGQAGDGG